MPSITALRSSVESSLAGRIPAPFAYRDRRAVDTASSGIPEIDRLAGGLPRGGLTEICGPPCSGRTSLLLSALAARTAQAEVCALVDGRDGFDPHAAQAAGVQLEQLLWVRCREMEQALRATDLLLRGGGFGLIAVDLADMAPETVRGVPLNAWFRFRRAVEDTPAILLLLEQESNAKTCASLVLRLDAEPRPGGESSVFVDLPARRLRSARRKAPGARAAGQRNCFCRSAVADGGWRNRRGGNFSDPDRVELSQSTENEMTAH
jgi:hypothetical protein